jgi:Ca2+-binding EF-hand superfamily protein
MKSLPIAVALALGRASAALAQTQPPASTTPKTASAAEAKFKSADTNNNGALEGAELNAFKSTLAQVDTDKDGKLSRGEFDAGVKAGHIK